MHRYTPVAVLIACLAAMGCGSSADHVEAPKETIPLEESQDGRGERFQSAQQEFNACLDEAGYEFRGLAGGEGDAAVIEDPDYQESLQRCANESGVADMRAEFAESRASRSPQEIRDDNEAILAVVDCLRSRGMDLDDPIQDETGALNLRQLLRSSSMDIRDDQQARDCLSEILLARRRAG